MINEILLRRKNKITIYKDYDIDAAFSTVNAEYAATIMKNVEDLGYTFSEKLYKVLKSMSISGLKQFYLELIPMLKNMVGADVQYNPMYPNFPESVMARDNYVLYINAIVHYWSNGTLYPIEERNERLPLFEETKVKVLDVGYMSELQDIFNNLCTSKTSLSNTDKDDLEWIFKNTSVSFPDEIPLKENVALIGKIYLENYPLATANNLQRYFKTATDVLRLITAMSDGDISLATNTKYRNFKRKERRILLELLNNCGNIEEDMVRYKNRWIRIGEKLHPGEYKQYVNVINAFRKLRNNIKIETFNGKVAKAIDEKDYKTALSYLKNRPGELARRLDYLLRNTDDKNHVVNAFKNVANGVSTPVLLQIRQHFINRMDDLKIRVFFPKGSLAKSYAIENNLSEIEEKYCMAIIKICENALVEEYKKRDFLGNVYLSEEFKNYIVPFNQRSASKSLKSAVRGSSFDIPESTKALRGFIWWTNTEDQRIDLDLSASFFDEKWEYITHISYTNLKSNKLNACHSGDITNGGDINGSGVSEFIDVDIENAITNGVRYVVFQVYGFCCPSFAKLPHAMFGWMNREDVNSGEIYEPKTVEQKMDLSSDSVVSIPVIFDCVTKKVVWCDMNISLDGARRHRGGNNVESNLIGVAATCYSMMNMKKPNLYDLINLHIQARGLQIDNKDNADVVFDVDDGITPFDTEVFMGEYL